MRFFRFFVVVVEDALDFDDGVRDVMNESIYLYLNVITKVDLVL